MGGQVDNTERAPHCISGVTREAPITLSSFSQYSMSYMCIVIPGIILQSPLRGNQLGTYLWDYLVCSSSVAENSPDATASQHRHIAHGTSVVPPLQRSGVQSWAPSPSFHTGLPLHASVAHSSATCLCLRVHELISHGCNNHNDYSRRKDNIIILLLV